MCIVFASTTQPRWRAGSVPTLSRLRVDDDDDDDDDDDGPTIELF